MIRGRFTLKRSRPFMSHALLRLYPAVSPRRTFGPTQCLLQWRYSLDYEMATFHRGFKSFYGLKLRLLTVPDG